MTNTQQTLLDLLRLALGNTNAITVPSDANWTEVMVLGERQGVLGVAFDALVQLKKSTLTSNHSPLTSFPDMDTLMDWLGQTSYMESVYEEYVSAIRSFGEFCKVQYVPVLLMKGYGCSLNYPVPNHRPCGDIDVYLGKNKSFIERLISNEGIQIDYDNDHHAVFSYHGFTVESHETILDANSHKSNGYINQLLEQLVVVDSTLRQAQDRRSSPTECLDGIYLPSAKFYSIHLLRHMASDFASVKTTLRHVLDWSTFVAKHDVDWNFVHEVAHKSNMNRFLDALNGICVHYLGYPSNLFPIEFRDQRLEVRVLNEILTCEDQVDAPHGSMSFSEKLKYGIAKTKRLWKNRWKYEIVYDESLLSSFVWKARNRWKH